MFNSVDSENEIALAKLSDLLGNYYNDVIKENGDAESLLRCSGISSLLQKYGKNLNPHTFNNGFKNENINFSPKDSINKICLEISDNKEVLFKFLNEFISRVVLFSEDDINLINNYLEILGYKLNIEKKLDDYSYEVHNYSLSTYTDGSFDRQDDISSYLHNALSSYSDTLLTLYNNAIFEYANSKYVPCITNCRILLEKTFKKLDSENNDFYKGVLAATNEKALPNTDTPKQSQNSIFEYWLKYKKGFNRFRFISTLYSVTSGLGVHIEEEASKEDALLCLRATEDILIWFFQSNKGIK